MGFGSDFWAVLPTAAPAAGGAGGAGLGAGGLEGRLPPARPRSTGGAKSPKTGAGGGGGWWPGNRGHLEK